MSPNKVSEHLLSTSDLYTTYLYHMRPSKWICPNQMEASAHYRCWKKLSKPWKGRSPNAWLPSGWLTNSPTLTPTSRMFPTSTLQQKCYICRCLGMWRCCSTCATFLPHRFWLWKIFQYFAPASNRLCSPSLWRARFRTAFLRRCFSRAQVTTRNQIRSHSRGCCARRSYAGRCVQPGTFPTCSGPDPASPRTKLLRLHHFSWTTCRHCKFFWWRRTLWLRCCWHPHCGIRARSGHWLGWQLADAGPGHWHLVRRYRSDFLWYLGWRNNPIYATAYPSQRDRSSTWQSNRFLWQAHSRCGGISLSASAGAEWRSFNGWWEAP